MIFTRRLTVSVKNLTQGGALQFGGEWFGSGGWRTSRVERVDDHAMIELENKAMLQGVSGYVYFHTSDHSQMFVFAFSCPITTACCFTARSGQMLPDCRALLERVPEVPRPGTGLRRAELCAWETIELQDEHVTVHCVVLPVDTSVRIPEELGQRLAKARMCRSTLTDGEVSMPSDGLIERHVVIEVENRSDEAFLLDGEWFDAGNWSKPVSRIAKHSRVRLEFTGDEVLRGVCGLVWYVCESGLEAGVETYLSAVFSNSFAGGGAFNAWAGPPPQELLQETYTAPGVGQQDGVQVLEGRGCAWNVVEQGSLLRVRLVVLQGLAPMDLLAYPSQTWKDALARTDIPVRTQTDRRTPPHREDHGDAPDTGEADDADARMEGDDGRKLLSHFANWLEPHDALEGVGSGLKWAGAGFIAGTAALVTAPVVGAREEGGVGFLKGIGVGAAGAVCLPIACGVMGVCQVVRGVQNTPEAIRQVQAGRRWDSDSGTWVVDFCNLREEADQVAAGHDSEMDDSDDEATFGVDAEGRPIRQVVDTDYYDMIGVHPSSVPSEIKKAYYKAALRVHPDKNPDDAEASKRFQELAQAYQILSDPKLRERYDQCGREGVSDSSWPSIDPILFFGLLFGSERFEKYTGKLYIANCADHIAKGGNRDSVERKVLKMVTRIRRQQFVREVEGATHLRERLHQWVVKRDEAGFISSISQEASELVRVSFGPQLLRTIGGIYESCAEQFLADARGKFSLETHLASLKDTTHIAKVRMQILSSVARSAFAIKRMHDTLGGSPAESEDEQKKIAAYFEESLPVYLQTIWDCSVADIESSLRHICNKVLKDVSAPWQIRHRRARALLRLGRVFRDFGQMEITDMSQWQVAKQHIEQALYEASEDSSRLKGSSRT